ncbi:MAG: biotin transporter BioY [Clostridium sp.]|nr:biotin transporter BioY [Clostridium sp.]MCM1548301.1 biotin transporter BioY [Ruminococcus sp.]
MEKTRTQTHTHTKTLNMVMCAMFAALIAVGAFIKIPIPYVPVTLQTFFVTLAGLLLGAKWGSLSALVYLITGLIGVPIFTEGGGPGYIFKTTFGYLIGFVIGAYVTGLIAHKNDTPSYKRLLCASFAGLGVIYICGMIYCYIIANLYLKADMSVKSLLLSCFVLVIPGDFILCFFASFLSQRLLPIIKNRL